MNTRLVMNCWPVKRPCVPSVRKFILLANSPISLQRYSGYALCLMDRFYKSCGLRVRCLESDRVFGLHLQMNVSRLVAAVRFIPTDDQHWVMRNVCVTASHRRQGLAGHLLLHSLPLLGPSVCYCYAADYLYPLYHRVGFQRCDPVDAPDKIAAEYQRYLKNRKNLQLLRYSGHVSSVG
jgi:ribosomal protein S18 acetylase RimI-like enzyme